MRQAVRARDDEIERTFQQKVALTSIFESDLLSMTDKIITGATSHQQRGTAANGTTSSVIV